MLFADGTPPPDVPTWMGWAVGVFLAAVFGAWGTSQRLNFRAYRQETERRNEAATAEAKRLADEAVRYHNAAMAELSRRDTMDRQDELRAKFRDAQTKELVMGLQEEIRRLRDELLSEECDRDA